MDVNNDLVGKNSQNPNDRLRNDIVENPLSSLKVLEERVRKNEEILDLKLTSYKNQLAHYQKYVALIVLFLSLIGVGSIATLIKSQVKTATELKLQEILTPKYIEERIYSKSEETIQKLVSDVEDKVAKYVGASLNYTKFRFEIGYLISMGKYEETIQLVKEAIQSIILIDRSRSPFLQHERFVLELTLAEVQICSQRYDESLETINKMRLPPIIGKHEEALRQMYICFAKKLQTIETDADERLLNKMLNEGISPIKKRMWSFELLERWAKEAKISNGNKAYIIQMVKMIKEAEKSQEEKKPK